MGGNPDGIRSLTKYSRLPAERIRYVPDADAATIRSIRRGVLFLMAFWSGPSVRALRAYKPPKWRPGDPIPGRAKEKPMEPAANLGRTHIRVARPTDDLDAVARFYREGLGFRVVGEFRNHDGFDGVMLGHPGAGYHLEFTHQHGHEVGRAPTDDNQLIFYLPDRDEWERAVRRMERLGYAQVEPANPYWKKQGATFCDPDGYRVVLQNATWPA